MRHGVTGAAVAGALLAGLAAGCSSVPPPYTPPGESTAIPTYDPGAEPSAAVLPLVPDAATELRVTDFVRIRQALGADDLTGKDPRPLRDAFWRRVADESPALTSGLLRPDDVRLAEEFEFTQDDVEWEATFSGGAEGFVLKFRPGLDMRTVQRAVKAGVGVLGGAGVNAEERIVAKGAVFDESTSWAADQELRGLVGASGNATYVTRDCLPFDETFGGGLEEQLAPSPSVGYGRVDELGPFSVVFGTEVVTAWLGEARTDAFDRLRLPDILPRTDPDFARGFTRGAADPESGRIGYDIGEPAVAARLTLEGQLPFAVCADV